MTTDTVPAELVQLAADAQAIVEIANRMTERAERMATAAAEQTRLLSEGLTRLRAALDENDRLMRVVLS